MGLKVSAGGDKIAPVPEGVQLAVCSGYYDLGTQLESSFKDREVKTEKRKLMLVWDLPHERIEIDGEDKPRQLSKRYTRSLDEKANLRKDLDAWRGRKFTPEELHEFDLDNVVGAPCQLNVVHDAKSDGRKFAVIKTITPLMKGMVKPALEREPVRYQVTDDTTGEFIVPPENTPHWIAKIIGESLEAKAAGWTPPERDGAEPKAAPAAPSAPAEDDTPF